MSYSGIYLCTILTAKLKIDKIFTFWYQFCCPPIFVQICLGGFMENFRTLGLIFKKSTHLFTLAPKYIEKNDFQSKIQNRKKNYFLLPILLPPYLGPYMCRRFHAKFQDSRTNNKKSTQPFHSNSQIMENNSVCSQCFRN